MIERLRVVNFQGHTDLDITLDPLTILVGRSGSGKSSAIRALKWCLTNRPEGDSFIKHGEKLCSVTVWVDGHRINRRRGDGCNEYFLDGEKLISFKHKVPDPIVDLLKMSADNWQDQHDGAYWISLSAPELARRLNEVVNLEAIDSALSNVGREVRRRKVILEVCSERIDSYKKTVNRLSWVPEARERLDDLLEIESELETTRQNAIKLRQIDSELSRHTQTLSLNQNALQAALMLTKRYSQFREISERLSTLKRLKNQWTKTQVNYKLPNLPKLQSTFARLEQVHDKLRRVRCLSLGLNQTEYDLWNLDSEIESKTKELRKLSNGRCPLCKRKLTPSR